MLISSSHQSLLIETIPLPFHRKQGLRLKYWSNERVHLTHVTTEPEQPTTGCCQHQDNLITSNSSMKMTLFSIFSTWMTLLCGLRGTMNGRMMPTTPQRAVKMTQGRNEAPMPVSV